MTHHHHVAADTHPEESATCPVMPGNTVLKAEAEEEGLVRDHHGVRYYLCCADCAPLWDADPAKYATA